MKPEKLSEIISGGEGLTVEFKQSRTKLNRDVFETVCAFLNRNGGHLFLGVELGSGIRNTYKYSKIYSGAEPIFTEGDVFRTMQASDQAVPPKQPSSYPSSPSGLVTKPVTKLPCKPPCKPMKKFLVCWNIAKLPEHEVKYRNI
jgi:hypothetical protein